MDKYEIWLLNNRLNNKVIGSKKKTGHYYVSDAIRDYEQEQVGNVAQPDACAQLCDGWRDVRKEIPSPRKRVIVTDGNTVTMAWISATIKSTWEGWIILDNEYFGEVIAWRELPDPPAFA